ncbi:hypothetical protein [Nocardiopsis suaedae]|uniref:Twitching motility protein PilT n=1 Tax=Nocardiopsis suaedae TaxID=3018444 RepID=A0ABT4THG9_9ACTN|nr:hypothetical protein [Nocardiopsis suaedae]MDA2804142.1 hypothetical protein [Nocardiopsis suaedae]
MRRGTPGKVWTLCQAEISDPRRPLLPIGVLAQTWRGGPRQAGLSRRVNACEIVLFEEPTAERIGVLLGRPGRADIVDAAAVIAAIEMGAAVVAADPGDIRRIAEAAEHDLPMITV